MKPTAAIARDEHPNFEGMAIVEKYEDFLNYVYPKVQNCPRKHGVLRDAVLSSLLEPVPAFYAAGKSRQVSRLYLIDAQLATLRFWLRFLADDARKVLTTHQAGEALRRLNEVGRMLGAWMGKLKPQAVGPADALDSGWRAPERNAGAADRPERGTRKG